MKQPGKCRSVSLKEEGIGEGENETWHDGDGVWVNDDHRPF